MASRGLSCVSTASVGPHSSSFEQLHVVMCAVVRLTKLGLPVSAAKHKLAQGTYYTYYLLSLQTGSCYCP